MKYKIFLNTCCDWRLYGEIEPVGLYKPLSLFEQKEFYVFKGDIEGFEFKLCSKSCEMLLREV